ncbi:hypothetical protein BT63DRAFT_35241 [Microthyrium microscopicum]|uniref:Uncharacterized protein n=1 Tax=Microthyrium microscopicum TaxID=703497 RepID=A0A6A6UU98_9PEZI|nr:hypothetical protein BT63DRAFT_35241 [Microthyrium microscopicum]
MPILLFVSASFCILTRLQYLFCRLRRILKPSTKPSMRLLSLPHIPVTLFCQRYTVVPNYNYFYCYTINPTVSPFHVTTSIYTPCLERPTASTCTAFVGRGILTLSTCSQHTYHAQIHVSLSVPSLVRSPWSLSLIPILLHPPPSLNLSFPRVPVLLPTLTLSNFALPPNKPALIRTVYSHQLSLCCVCSLLHI